MHLNRFPRLQSKHFCLTWVIALAQLVSLPLAEARTFTVGSIDIEQPYATATVPGQAVGGVFFTHIANRGASADRLLAASVHSEWAASTELHTMSTANDVMTMQRIPHIDIPAKTTVPMTRGLKKDGYHVMLMGLKKPLKVGDTVPLKLTFAKAGSVNVTVNVQALSASQASQAPHVSKQSKTDTTHPHSATGGHSGHKH